MNNQMAPELDPLSSYNLNNYPNLENFGNPSLPFGNSFPYSVKVENYQNPNYYNLMQGIPPKCAKDTIDNSSVTLNTSEDAGNETQPIREQTQDNEYPSNTDNTEEQDIKPDITGNKLLNSRKIKKERSKYFSEKITEKDFKFYGCSVCNINFKELQELDNHVLTHKDRLTSYDWRVKNQIKKKKMKKELKKNKKLKKKVKAEPEKLSLEVEIKSEEGYIGNEKASDFVNNTESDNQSSKENNGEKSKNKETNATEANGGNKKQEMLNLQKIYKCFACQKQFTLSYYLKLHVRSHTDEKPYTCPECGQSFITASKLGRHNKRFHLAIRYQCRICYRYFSRFEFLTRHFDKKHPDDKLEGEPYDFNAILPYLKELEEQLREKTEKEKAEPKPDDPWSTTFEVEAKTEPDVKEESTDIIEHNNITVTIEQVKVDMDEFEVKVEGGGEKGVYDGDGDGDGDGDSRNDYDFHDEVKDESDHMKDENLSDEDYFPSNTWAAKPEIEDPPSPKRVKSEDRVKCPVCQKRFSTASYMRIHMRTHTGEKPFKCYICNMGFITSSKMHRHVLTHPESWAVQSASYMRIHMQSHTEEKPFKCYICNMGFITSSKMHRHVLTHPESWADDEVKEEKNGEEEKKEGADIKTEEEANTEENKKAKKLRMKKALAKFSKKSRTTEKKKRLCQKRPHSCEYCHKRFLHLETLQVHKKCHEGESVVYKCTFCLAEHPDEAAQKAHEASHQGPKPYLCTICGRAYKKRETMIYHRKNHKPDREFICDICTKSFNAQCKLQRHIVSHRTQRFVLRYECPVCAHMFHTKYHVQMHLTTHQKEGLIQEENRNEILAMVLQNARKIPKTADAPPALADIAPGDERSRVCNICGEVFQHFYYLEEHLKSHGSKIAIEDSEKNEEKKHVCTVCNKGFKLHYYLKLHSFTHTKEKPFICQQCGKGFITRGKLKRHIETHTGLKKYQCHICYKFFTRPSYLRIHVRTIHGTQDYNFRLENSFGGDYTP